MEPDEISKGADIMEHLEIILQRTPDVILTADDEGEEFESVEHQNIGNKVKLRFPASAPQTKGTEQEILGADRPLGLPNGLKLTFGQIIALAGDFYGVPEHPIIDPKERPANVSAGRMKRFRAAYGTLADENINNVKKELDQILKIMTIERKAVEAVLEKKAEGVTMVAICDEDGGIRVVPKDVYDKLGNSLVKKWDEVTGGYWIKGIPIIFGRIMKLAENNHDHFLPFAKDAYQAGHALALEQARKASKAEDLEEKIKLLEEAYSIDAFACHFFTDSFSSGHLRTPRLELGEQVTPSKAGHLLCKYMHDEDNKFGLRVTNKRGDKWIAYGDGMLLNNESEGNLRLAVSAVQASVDQLFEAFLSPEKMISSNSVTDFIPFVDPNEKNNYPMFQVKEGKLLRRADLNNLSDPETVGNWWGWTTVAELSSYKPGKSAIDKYIDDIEGSGCRGCGQSLDPQIAAETGA